MPRGRTRPRADRQGRACGDAQRDRVRRRRAPRAAYASGTRSGSTRAAPRPGRTLKRPSASVVSSSRGGYRVPLRNSRSSTWITALAIGEPATSVSRPRIARALAEADVDAAAPVAREGDAQLRRRDRVRAVERSADRDGERLDPRSTFPRRVGEPQAAAPGAPARDAHSASAARSPACGHGAGYAVVAGEAPCSPTTFGHRAVTSTSSRPLDARVVGRVEGRAAHPRRRCRPRPGR